MPLTNRYKEYSNAFWTFAGAEHPLNKKKGVHDSKLMVPLSSRLSNHLIEHTISL